MATSATTRGLAEVLRAGGYRVAQPNAMQRATRRVAATRWGAWSLARTMHHVDRVTLRVSHGQVMASAMTAGIPVLTVVTTGARTGRRRTAPLIGVPVGEDIAVIGTHFGQTHTPGWYHNMLANPAVEVTYRDTTVAAVAREAGPGERQTIWDQAAAVYAGYQVYQRRITGRDIHVMILEAAPASPEPGRPTSAG